MKSKKLFAALAAVVAGVAAFSFAACGDDPAEPNNPDNPNDPNNPVDPNPPVTEVYGLPVADTGRYIKDSDLIADGDTRYLLYTTNETPGENDNMIAVRKGTFEAGEGKGWKYGAESAAITGEVGAWDENIASASMVKGSFTYEETEYSWLMAYCATKESSERQYNIGLAVATAPDGEWTKVSETPLIQYDADVYGATSVGCYAPSLVNLNKESAVRVFYTYADAYGHFAKFVDIDASDLGLLYTDAGRMSGEVQCPNHGSIAGGDNVAMFPNADFAYDAAAEKFYAIKDYSPAAATKPNYADRIQLLTIAEEELYTEEVKEGWVGLKTWDFSDTEDGLWERLYGACIVSDAYGHVDGTNAQEIIYNVCDLEMNDENWEFTQNLQSFVYTPEAE